MIIASLLIYAFFSLFLSITFYGRINLAKFIQIFFLTSFGINVIIYLGLDLFVAINKPLLFLFIQIVVCLLLSLIIRLSSTLSMQEYKSRLKISFSEFKWFDYSFVVFIAIILSAFFVVGITTPPNNLDSLDPTGLTRILFWIQEGTLDYGKTLGLASIFDPIFLHIQGVWLFTLRRSEYLFFLVQWFSLVVSTVTVYNISRSLNFSKTNSLTSSVVGLSLPVVLMQTYSFQGDLTVGVLILVCFSFVMDWLKTRSKIDLVMAFLAIILALGTKKAAFLAIPIFGILIISWLIGRLKYKKIIPWVTGSAVLIIIAGFILVGQVILRQGGALAGVPLIYDNQVSTIKITEKVQYNFPRFLYQLIGLDGLPRFFQNDLIPIKAELFQKIIIPSSVELQKDIYLQPGFNDTEKFLYEAPLILNEDGAWFGPLAFLLIPSSIFFSLFSKHKYRKKYAILTSFFFVMYFLMVIIQRPGWDPYQGRYFILPILPMIPMVSILIPDKRFWKTMILIIIIPLSLFLSVNTFLANNSKPIINQGTFWRLEMSIPENTTFRRTMKNYLVPSIEKVAEAALNRRLIYDCPYWNQVYYSDFGYFEMITFIDPLISNHSTVYTNIRPSALDYGLFGKDKDRKLVRVEDISNASTGYFITKSNAQIPFSKNIELLGYNDMFKVYLVHK